jgi:Ni,Fe-hydrogenase I large subunit
MSQRITIDPITRIEGHLRIDCEIDAMVSGAGFRIEALDRYRFNRPAALATLYRGRARPA